MPKFTDRDSHMAHRRHEFLADMQDVAKKELTAYLPEPAAEMVASALTDHLATHWGGQLINIPKDYRWRLSQRDSEIYAAFNGYNYAELAQQYGLTQIHMHRLIRNIRDRLKKASDARNRDLFHS